MDTHPTYLKYRQEKKKYLKQKAGLAMNYASLKSKYLSKDNFVNTSLQRYYHIIGNVGQASFLVSRILWDGIAIAIRGTHPAQANTMQGTPTLPEVLMVCSTLSSIHLFSERRSFFTKTLRSAEVIYLLQMVLDDLNRLVGTRESETLDDLIRLENLKENENHSTLFTKMSYYLISIFRTHLLNLETLWQRLEWTFHSFGEKQVYKHITKYDKWNDSIKTIYQKVINWIRSQTNFQNDKLRSLFRKGVFDKGIGEKTLREKLVSIRASLDTLITEIKDTYRKEGINYQNQLVNIFPFLMERYRMNRVANNFIHMMLYHGNQSSAIHSQQAIFKTDYEYFHSLLKHYTDEKPQEDATVKEIVDVSDKISQSRFQFSVFVDTTLNVTAFGAATYFAAKYAILAVKIGLVCSPHVQSLVLAATLVGVLAVAARVSSKYSHHCAEIIVKEFLYPFRNINRLYYKIGSEIVFGRYLPAVISWINDETPPEVIRRIGFCLADFMYRHSLYFCQSYSKGGSKTRRVQFTVNNPSNLSRSKKCDFVKYPTRCQYDSGEEVEIIGETGVCNYGYVNTSTFPFRYNDDAAEKLIPLRQAIEQRFFYLVSDRKLTELSITREPMKKALIEKAKSRTSREGGINMMDFIYGMLYYTVWSEKKSYPGQTSYPAQRIVSKLMCCNYLLKQIDDSYDGHIYDIFIEVFSLQVPRFTSGQESIQKFQAILPASDIQNMMRTVYREIKGQTEQYTYRWKPSTHNLQTKISHQFPDSSVRIGVSEHQKGGAEKDAASSTAKETPHYFADFQELTNNQNLIYDALKEIYLYVFTHKNYAMAERADEENIKKRSGNFRYKGSIQEEEDFAAILKEKIKYQNSKGLGVEIKHTLKKLVPNISFKAWDTDWHWVPFRWTQNKELTEQVDHIVDGSHLYQYLEDDHSHHLDEYMKSLIQETIQHLQDSHQIVQAKEAERLKMLRKPIHWKWKLTAFKGQSSLSEDEKEDSSDESVEKVERRNLYQIDFTDDESEKTYTALFRFSHLEVYFSKHFSFTLAKDSGRIALKKWKSLLRRGYKFTSALLDELPFIEKDVLYQERFKKIQEILAELMKDKVSSLGFREFLFKPHSYTERIGAQKTLFQRTVQDLKLGKYLQKTISSTN